MGAVGLAVFVQAYELTGSPAAVGAFGLVQFTAMFVGVAAGSAIVDHIDRRSLLLISQAGFGISAGALLIGSLLGDPPLALLYVASGVGSVFAAVHFPTRAAMITPVVEPPWLTTAMTLEVIVWNTTMILGPIIGGLLLASFGLAGVYAFSCALHTGMSGAVIVGDGGLHVGAAAAPVSSATSGANGSQLVPIAIVGLAGLAALGWAAALLQRRRPVRTESPRVPVI